MSNKGIFMHKYLTYGSVLPAFLMTRNMIDVRAYAHVLRARHGVLQTTGFKY